MPNWNSMTMPVPTPSAKLMPNSTPQYIVIRRQISRPVITYTLSMIASRNDSPSVSGTKRKWYIAVSANCSRDRITTSSSPNMALSDHQMEQPCIAVYGAGYSPGSRMAARPPRHCRRGMADARIIPTAFHHTAYSWHILRGQNDAPAAGSRRLCRKLFERGQRVGCIHQRRPAAHVDRHAQHLAELLRRGAEANQRLGMEAETSIASCRHANRHRNQLLGLFVQRA